MYSDDENANDESNYFDENEETTVINKDQKQKDHQNKKVAIANYPQLRQRKEQNVSFPNYKNIHSAVQDNNINVVKAFLQNDARLVSSRDSHEYTPLHIAAKYSSLTCAAELIKANANPNDRAQAGRTPLHIAIVAGNSEMVQLLIDSGANVNAQDDNGSTPLHYAASWNKLDIMQQLISNGAQTLIRNNKGETAYSKCKSVAAREIFDNLAKKK